MPMSRHRDGCRALKDGLGIELILQKIENRPCRSDSSLGVPEPAAAKSHLAIFLPDWCRQIISRR